MHQNGQLPNTKIVGIIKEVSPTDEDEFGLTSNDEIELEVDTNKAPDKLAGVLFGGFEF